MFHSAAAQPDIFVCEINCTLLKSNLGKKKRINYQLNANISVCCTFAKNKHENIDQNVPVLQFNCLYFIFLNPEDI